MQQRSRGGLFFVAVLSVLAVVLGEGSGVLAVCGPFTDVAGDGFCSFVLEIFTLGITTGTSPTTYEPTSNVTRLQMAAFLSRSVDGVLKRGSRRAALGQHWTPQNATALRTTTVGTEPWGVRSDGADLWIANHGNHTVSRVRASDGRLMETWTGATNSTDVLVAAGYVFATGWDSNGNLYRIDPSQPAGSVTTVATSLGGFPRGLAFDGSRVWASGPVTFVGIVTPSPTLPWTVTTVTAGFDLPFDSLYDGSNVWVTDLNVGTLLKLDNAGAVLQTVTVGLFPSYLAFDGANLWVPNNGSESVSVVRGSSGVVLATLTGNGLDHPLSAAFDGQRILVTSPSGNRVSLWKAADLTQLGNFPTGASTGSYGACSDGINFWITLQGANQLARF